MSCVPTVETGRLQEEAEQGRGAKQGSDGTTWLCNGNKDGICHVFGLCLEFVFVFQVAVEKYEEVLHHLGFAQELHKTLDGLTQNVSL